MPWTDEQWDVFTTILQRGFVAKDPFTEADAGVYRILLDTVDPDAAMQSVREIVLEGKALRPKPGEIVARVNRDTGRPTFEEAFRLIYGRGGILASTPHRAGAVLTYATEAERRRLYDQAAIDRAAELHPLVGAFVVRQGVARLRELPVNDPDYGELRRKELHTAWDAHVDAFASREVVALAAGGDTRSGLRQLDPLAALGLHQAAPRELETGATA
ncbi:MAG: hypothetical protein JWM47_4570 [Acidimicrobiales bacterium]|nr:hypothetical protein [Acidimicrobiales bacterium]